MHPQWETEKSETEENVKPNFTLYYQGQSEGQLGLDPSGDFFEECIEYIFESSI